MLMRGHVSNSYWYDDALVFLWWIVRYFNQIDNCFHGVIYLLALLIYISRTNAAFIIIYKASLPYQLCIALLEQDCMNLFN